MGAKSSSIGSIDAATGRFMKERLGFNFDNVRIHTDEAAAKSAESIGAQAYTVGRDIFFGRNMYEPGTIRGKELLAYELVHVILQAQSTEIKPHRNFANSSTDSLRAEVSHSAPADEVHLRPVTFNRRTFEVRDVILNAAASRDVRTHGNLCAWPRSGSYYNYRKSGTWI